VSWKLPLILLIPDNLRTLDRVVKVRWLECLVSRALESQNTLALSEYEPIERLASEILQSCDEYPVVLTSTDDINNILTWVAFYKLMRAAVSHLSCFGTDGPKLIICFGLGTLGNGASFQGTCRA
jgi:hypothetical protein